MIWLVSPLSCKKGRAQLHLQQLMHCGVTLRLLRQCAAAHGTCTPTDVRPGQACYFVKRVGVPRMMLLEPGLTYTNHCRRRRPDQAINVIQQHGCVLQRPVCTSTQMQPVDALCSSKAGNGIFDETVCQRRGRAARSAAAVTHFCMHGHAFLRAHAAAPRANPAQCRPLPPRKTLVLTASSSPLSTFSPRHAV